MEPSANAPAVARQAITARPASGPAALTGTGGPAAADRAASKLGAIHAVLLVHDQHAGKACLIFPACLIPLETNDDQHCPAP